VGTKATSTQERAGSATTLKTLTDTITRCRACPRLVEWREKVARDKRPGFADEIYWGRPVPGFGDTDARIAIVGLAPAAHGGNRTGRIFTGDRSGDFLFASLHRCGFANQSESRHRGDGLLLDDAYVTAAVRCAPPGNKPAPDERDRCHPYLVRELELLHNLGVLVALGSFAWSAALRAHVSLGGTTVRPAPHFGHGITAELERFALVGCFHPSQQNTFTGKLTEDMIDEVFALARRLGYKSRD
jgi:uracil-DNA glycosylase family 4